MPSEPAEQGFTYGVADEPPDGAPPALISQISALRVTENRITFATISHRDTTSNQALQNKK
jgi:hypothetical protein